jgi:hypothetical protein
LFTEVVKAGRSKVQKKALPNNTVNGKLLHATAVVQQMARMCNSARMKQSQGINFVVADVAHHNMILSMAWLQNHIPDIHWDIEVWYWRNPH